MQLYIKAPFCHATKDYTHVIFGPKLFRVFLHQTENECLTPLPLLNTQKESTSTMAYIFRNVTTLPPVPTR
jgi:hypothetical protein